LAQPGPSWNARNALIRERRDEVSEAKENLERTKDEVGVRIATVYNKLETTRSMVKVAREYLDARRETARISEDQFKRGALLTSQRDASRAQEVKAEAEMSGPVIIEKTDREKALISSRVRSYESWQIWH
jgi:outer membrane protein TolC